MKQIVILLTFFLSFSISAAAQQDSTVNASPRPPDTAAAPDIPVAPNVVEMPGGLTPDTNIVIDKLDTGANTAKDTVSVDTSHITDSTAKTDSINNIDTVGKVEVGERSILPSDTLKGTVYNNNGTDPIMAADVKWTHNQVTVQTDEKGHFAIPYYKNDELVVSAIGLTDKAIAVAPGDNDLKIIMGETSSTHIGEVVVTALGLEKDTRTLSYNVQQLSGASLTEVRDPNGNVMNSLNGKVAGLTTTPASGGPGSATKVVLRGNKSISGSNNALIAVDGIPMINNIGTQPADENGGYSGSDGSVNINPDDIASVSVLSGASAAALYGGNAGNGAIIITTKKGAPGPLKISYNGSVTWQPLFMMLDLQNQYGRGYDGVTDPGSLSGFSWGARGATYEDNVKDFFRNAMSVNNSISLSGGGKSMQAYLSYTNNYSTGIFRQNLLQRNTLNARVTGQYHNRLFADLKVTYMDQAIKNKPRSGEIGTALNAYIMPRDVSPEELNNYQEFNQYGVATPTDWPTTNTSIYMNPNWLVNNTSFSEYRKRLMMLASAKYNFTDWLNIQARYNIDNINDNSQTRYAANTLVLAPNPGGYLSLTSAQYMQQYFDLMLNGNNSFAKYFTVNYVLGGSVLASNSNALTATASGLNKPNLFSLANGISNSSINSTGQAVTQSLFATAELGFKNYLYLDVTARNDWYSIVSKPYNYFYPSVGVSAIISDMLKLPVWVSLGKIRASYVGVGNAFASNGLYDIYSIAPGTSYDQGSQGGFISRSTQKGNPNLRPVGTRSVEVGTDWSFFDDRLSLNVTYYHSNTYDQQVNVPLPRPTGYASQWINLGNIENEGLEILVGATPVQKKDFVWNTRVVFTTNRNKITKLSDSLKSISVSGGSVRIGNIQVNEGGSFGDIYGQKWAQDGNGNYIVDDKGLPVIDKDQSQQLGNFNPKFQFGWGNTFTYKGISLDFQIDGRIGGNVVSGTDGYLAYYGDAAYTTKYRDGGWVLPAVHEDGTPNTTAISAEDFWTRVSQGRTLWTQFFMYDATNIRLRQVALGYTFNFNSKYISSAKLSLVGQNLFFFYRGRASYKIPGIDNNDRRVPFDPEMSLGAGTSQGLESGIVPGQHSFGLNLKVWF